jgi:periplasmic protein TonB
MSLHVPRWTTPSEPRSKISLQPGTTVPRFLHPRFGSRFTENLKEWLKPSLRGGPSAMPVMLTVNAQEWSQGFWRSQALSFVIYSGAVALILLLWSKPQAKPGLKIHDRATLLSSDLSDYTRGLPPGAGVARGGGGGGIRSATPVTIGKAPKFTTIQLAPPSLPHDAAPKLVAEASLLGDPALQFPSPILDRFGDPLAGLLTDSDGQGRGGGMGDGDGTGDGKGLGPGLGPGRNGGAGGDTFRAGHNGVGFPECTYCPDAKYSEMARKAKFQGLVILQIVVTPDGRASHIEIVSGPGLGLEEEAVEAVKNWRFKPALGPNRKPVATQIEVEVQFRLL